MELTEQLIAGLRPLWEEDCQKLIPEFELMDAGRMMAAIDYVRDNNDWMEDWSDIRVVASVLRNMQEHETEVPASWWWVQASMEILGDVEVHPWVEVIWWLYNDMRGKRETSTLWGSASCAKTETFAGMVVTNMGIWPGYFHAYVGSPYKNAGDDKIWKGVNHRIKRWMKHRPEWADDLGIESFKSVDGEVTMEDFEGKSSTANFVSFQTTAHVQGKKKQREGVGIKSSRRKGAMMLIGDELIVNPSACKEFSKAEGNYLANDNFMGWVGMNPLPEQVRHANAIDFSSPIDVPENELNEHKHYSWRTKRGRLLRLCMDNSPNRHYIEPVFDFLINHDQVEAATKRGEDNYKAQVAAWGWSNGLGNGGPLSMEAVNRESHQTHPVWATPPHSWAFFDFAFGGSDPAGFARFKGGNALIGATPVPVVDIQEQQKMSIERVWKPSEPEVAEFKRLCTDRGGRAPDTLIAGKELDANHHMVWRMLKEAHRMGIPPGRVSFDSSLRPDVTLMAVRALGSVPWYYSGTRPLKDEQRGWPLWPPVLNQDGTRKEWDACHGTVVSAAWRFAEHLVARGHVYGLESGRKGLMEILSRLWVPGTQGRSDVEAKKKLKMSPMWGETIALGLVFGVRFCGALPNLSSEKPEAVGEGGEFATHDIFRIKSRRVASVWR